MFGDTNVLCGFSKEMAWMIPLFSDEENQKLANLNRIKLISSYMKIDDAVLQGAFKEFVLSSEKINIDKIEFASEVLRRLSFSNSMEIFTYRNQLAGQILHAEDPIECLNTIEDIFIRSNIPTVGKIYACFDTLHPNFEGFDFNYSRMSPMLGKASNRTRQILIF